MKRAEFAAAVAVLAAGLRREIGAQTAEVWYGLLAHLSLAQLQGAVAAFLRSGDEWPNAGKLLRLVDAGPSIEDRAAIALQTVRVAVRRAGWYGSVEFDDPLTTVVVRDCGGWQRMCDEDLSCPHFARRWAAAYAMRARCGFPDELALPLLGENDRLNGAAGYAAGKPALFVTGLPRLDVPRLPSATSTVPEPHRLTDGADRNG